MPDHLIRMRNGAPARTAAIAVLVLLFFGCTDLLTDATRSGPATFSLGLSFAEELTGGGPREAYASVDRIRIRVLRDGVEAMNVIRGYDSGAEETRVPLAIDVAREDETAELHVELLSGDQPLFAGESTISLSPGRTVEVEVTLRAIVAGVHIDAPAEVLLDALGAGTQLTAYALFATGDTIPGEVLTWSSGAPSIVEVDSRGRVVARAEGEATVSVHHGALTDQALVRVRQAVASVQLVPSSAILQTGESLQLQVQVRDSGGNPIQGRSVGGWTSSAPDVIEVGATGIIVGGRFGTAVVTATVEGVQGQGEYQVAPRPRIIVGTTSITLSGSAGTSDPLSGSVAITSEGVTAVTGLAVADIGYAQGPGGWLTATLSGTTTPAMLMISAQTSGLDPGQYLATVAITSPVAENSPVAVDVLLDLGVPGRFALLPDSVFLAVGGGEGAALESIHVENLTETRVDGLSIGAIEYGSGASGWLEAVLQDSRAPTTLLVAASASGLQDGNYSASIPIFSPHADNSPGTVTVSLEVTSDPCAAVAGTIGVGDSVSGVLQTTDCMLWGEGPFSQRWRLALEDSTAIRITLSSDDFDPVLEVTTLGGDTLDFSFGALSEFPATVNTTLPAGTYNLKLYGGVGQTGAYDLSVDESEDCFVDAGVLGIDDLVGSAITTASCIFDEFGSFAERWRLEITETEVVEIVMSSTAFEPLLVLTDEADDWLGVGLAEEGSGVDVARITILLEPGSYSIYALADLPGATGSYQLSTGIAETAFLDGSAGSVSGTVVLIAAPDAVVYGAPHPSGAPRVLRTDGQRLRER
jgi:hypothetical protein